MVFILFSASGPDFLVADFIEKYKPNNISIWLKGQSLRSGSLHKDSGISVNITDAKNTNQVIPLIESFLNENKYWLVALNQQSVERLIHLGVTVGEENSFAPCLEFDISFLEKLVQYKISLHVSAYPTNDKDEMLL